MDVAPAERHELADAHAAVEGDAEQLGVLTILGGACGLLVVAELVRSASVARRRRAVLTTLAMRLGSRSANALRGRQAAPSADQRGSIAASLAVTMIRRGPGGTVEVWSRRSSWAGERRIAKSVCATVVRPLTA